MRISYGRLSSAGQGGGGLAIISNGAVGGRTTSRCPISRRSPALIAASLGRAVRLAFSAFQEGGQDSLTADRKRGRLQARPSTGIRRVRFSGALIHTDRRRIRRRSVIGHAEATRRAKRVRISKVRKRIRGGLS